MGKIFKKDKQFIIKIQMPIIGENNILIYNKNRSIFTQLPVTKEIKKFMGKKLKKYVYARYTDPDKEYSLLEILEEVPEQNW